MAKTFSYILGGSPEDIVVGEQYYFGQLVEGEGDIEQLFEDGCVSIGADVVEFIVVEKDNDNILNSTVKIIDIY